MEHLLNKLIAKENLCQDEIQFAFHEALNAQNPVQVGAFLVLLESKRPTSNELYWALQCMEKQGFFIDPPFPVLDIVGTGGDLANTFNVSTGAAFLTAACGVKVAKHGNRSVSSKSGSLDVLKALGVEVDLQSEGYLTCLKEVGLTFMPAPRFHPTWKALRDLRTQLKVRTLLNIMGPLLNPASARYQLVGVYQESLLDLVAGALKKQKKKALVVCSQQIDELTPLGPAQVRWVSSEKIESQEIDPQALNLPKCSLKEIQGQGPDYNAKKLIEVFKGEEGPWADTVILNTAAALYLRERVSSLEEGIELAKAQHKRGGAYEILEKIRKLSKHLEGASDGKHLR